MEDILEKGCQIGLLMRTKSPRSQGGCVEKPPPASAVCCHLLSSSSPRPTAGVCYPPLFAAAARETRPLEMTRTPPQTWA